MAKNMALRLLLIILFALAACTSKDNTSQISKIYSLYKGQNQNKELKNFNRNEFSNIKYPLIEVRTNGILIQALMLPLSERDGYRNYTSGSGQNLTLKNHHIVRTHGMNIFLNSSDVKNQNPISNIIKLDNWPKRLKREYRFLTPLFSEYKVEAYCSIEILEKEKLSIIGKDYKLTRIKEKCDYQNENFENNFWASNDGFIWKSKQWIPYKNIYIEINLIKNSYN